MNQRDKKKTSFITLPRMIAATTLLVAGYVLITSLPDLVRYVKISTM
ncbi:MAG: hypothetical protein WBW53_08200 [Terriglobales bacterium]